VRIVVRDPWFVVRGGGGLMAAFFVWGICTGSMNNVGTTHPPSLRSGTLPSLEAAEKVHHENDDGE
jgi:hypothetical protein